jgi:hypothetical protein
MGGWVGGWVAGKAGLRIAYSNQKAMKLSLLLYNTLLIKICPMEVELFS